MATGMVFGEYLISNTLHIMYYLHVNPFEAMNFLKIQLNSAVNHIQNSLMNSAKSISKLLCIYPYLFDVETY